MRQLSEVPFGTKNYCLNSIHVRILQSKEDLILHICAQFFLVHGHADDKVNMEHCADLLELFDAVVYLILVVFKLRQLQEAIEIHLLDITILRDDSADKTDKFIVVL